MVFSSCGLGNGLSNSAVAKLLERMGRTDCTIHGFRSTFMDWSQEQTSLPKAVIDHSRAHVTATRLRRLDDPKRLEPVRGRRVFNLADESPSVAGADFIACWETFSAMRSRQKQKAETAITAIIQAKSPRGRS
jgi:hypothetical protein